MISSERRRKYWINRIGTNQRCATCRRAFIMNVMSVYCDNCRSRNLKKRRYNLSDNKLDKLESITSCQICGSPKDLCIDHDHSDGMVRGVICRLCNIALGAIKDNISILSSMINYINNARSISIP